MYNNICPFDIFNCYINWPPIIVCLYTYMHTYNTHTHTRLAEKKSDLHELIIGTHSEIKYAGD